MRYCARAEYRRSGPTVCFEFLRKAAPGTARSVRKSGRSAGTRHFLAAGKFALKLSFSGGKCGCFWGKDEEKAFNFYADCARILRTAQFRNQAAGRLVLSAGLQVFETVEKLYSQAKISPVMRAVLPVFGAGAACCGRQTLALQKALQSRQIQNKP